MFWAGPITDKVYFLLLSFLFTQDLQLDLKEEEASPCRPQMWCWIHQPSSTNLSDRSDWQLRRELLSNPWSAPFLHPRFAAVIKFKMWDTKEQLHAVPELKPSWHILRDAVFQGEQTASIGPSMMDSSHAEKYDHSSVVLSDLARFVLCHRFGGVYVDVDVIFLRDWSELLRAPWAFAYRWSRLPAYNTAVLRLRRGSALGTFILRTALAHGFNLHPMAVTRYLADAGLNPLLAQLPDALFDPAWLNVGNYVSSNVHSR
jgi:DDB1- and CUL4-associated factor 13